MTFASSSLGNKKLNSMSQWAITMRRKWVLALSLLITMISFPISAVVGLTGEINSLKGTMSDVALKSTLVNDFRSVIGFDNTSFVFIAILAFVIAIQGYSYLYRRQMVDFYDSQPFTRRSFFFRMYINGYLIFAASLAISYILSICVAAAMGIFRLALVAEAFVEFVELSLMFMGIYSITILGAVVSGTLIMGILVGAFFVSAENLIRGVIHSASSTYLATFYAPTWDDVFRSWSPFFQYIFAGRSIGSYKGDTVFKIDMVLEHLHKSIVPDLETVLVIVLATLIAWYAFKRRKAESTGRSIVYSPVEWLIKLICGLSACILVGILLDTVTQGAVFVAFFGVAITAFLMSAIMEIIFESDFKAMFKKAWHIPVLAIIGIAVILGYRFDVTGYESYIPAVDKVASCSLFNPYGMGKTYYGSDGKELDYNYNYMEEEMFLTDIAGVEDIARIGQDEQIKSGRQYKNLNVATYISARENLSESEETHYWDRVVLYRMKNGKKIYRKLLIPESADPAVMDRITANTEYSYVLINLDEELDKKVKETESYENLVFNTGCQQVQGKGELYDGFIENFRKDVEENYCFSLAYNSTPLGTVYYSPSNNFHDYSKPTFYLNYIIFPEYKNTLEFMKKNDLYLDSILPVEYVNNIVVSYDPNVYDDTVYSETDSGEEPLYEEVRKKEYNDKEQINTIIDKAVYDGEDWEWRSAQYMDYDVEVVVNMNSEFKDGNNGESGGSYYVYFRKGEMPEFIIRDLDVKDL